MHRTPWRKASLTHLPPFVVAGPYAPSVGCCVMRPLGLSEIPETQPLFQSLVAPAPLKLDTSALDAFLAQLLKASVKTDQDVQALKEENAVLKSVPPPATLSVWWQWAQTSVESDIQHLLPQT